MVHVVSAFNEKCNSSNTVLHINTEHMRDYGLNRHGLFRHASAAMDLSNYVCFGSLADVRGQSAGVKIATVFADGLNAMAEHF